MSFVVILPHSTCNPTDKFEVVDHRDYNLYTLGEREDLPIAGTFSHAEDAQLFRDALNDKL